jgi:hypothetical protein
LTEEQVVVSSKPAFKNQGAFFLIQLSGDLKVTGAALQYAQPCFVTDPILQFVSTDPDLRLAGIREGRHVDESYRIIQMCGDLTFRPANCPPAIESNPLPV